MRPQPIDHKPVYPTLRRAPLVCVLVLGVSGSCASTPVEVHAPDDVRGFDDPESAVAAFATAWNDGVVDGVVATFAPDRRGLVRSHLQDDPRRLRGFRVIEARVSKQCHVRGSYWKTATLQLGPRTAPARVAAVDREIVWLRLQGGHWFMYSL